MFIEQLTSIGIHDNYGLNSLESIIAIVLLIKLIFVI